MKNNCIPLRAKLRKNQTKGFTLVELIVVLVILGILAALLIPSLTKYIDKANEKKAIAECRQAVVASQTIASEDYGSGKEVIDGVAFLKAHHDEIKTLSEVSGIIEAILFPQGNSTHLPATILKLKYKTSNQITVLYDIDGKPKYQLDDGTVANNAPGYSSLFDGLTQEQIDEWREDYRKVALNPESIINDSQAIQWYLKKTYGGNLPKISPEELKHIPDGPKGEENLFRESCKNAVWKPIKTKTGEIIMVADMKADSHIGDATVAFIYYNGAYYYYHNEHNQYPLDDYVNEVNFDIANLNESLPDKTKGWEKVKP